MGKMKRPNMNRILSTPTGGMMSTLDALQKKKTMEYEVINIPISKLVPIEYNREVYDVDQLDFIGATIQQYGVLQPLIVQAHADDDKYSIVAGERRYQSVMATQKDKDHPTGTLPCRVLPADMEEVQVKILLLLTNATSRARTADTQILELKNLVTLIDEAKASGIDIGFSVKELATQQLQISERQYQKYQSVLQVIPELQEPLKEYDINLASAIGTKPEEVQQEVYERWQESPEQDLKQIYESVNDEYKNFRVTAKKYEAEIASLRQELKAAKQQDTPENSGTVAEIKEKIKEKKEAQKEHQESLKDTLTDNRKEASKKIEKDEIDSSGNPVLKDIKPVKTPDSSLPDPYLLTSDKALNLAEVSVRALSIRSKEGTEDTISRLEDLKRQIDDIIGRIKNA